MSTKIGLVSLGCAKNRVDSESMLGILVQEGFEITPNPEDAEVIIINTCAFIESAREEAINSIIEMAQFKSNGNCKCLVVTGCLSQRYEQEIKEQLPEVDVILGISGYDRISDAIREILNNKKDKYLYTDMNCKLDYLNGARVLTTPKGSAYIKVSEGCDNCCSYCAIPKIRGPFRSRPIEEIINEVTSLAADGIREAVIIAQDTSRYGKDLYGTPMLSKLIKEIAKIEGIEWIRILYLYPDEISEELIQTMKNCKKVVHYVDLPVQHISDNILSAMNRRGTKKQIMDVLHKFKKEIPDVVIRTSIIVGFPGETSDDYNQLKEFIKEIRFDRMGIFTYSKEDGTLAAEMHPQISNKVKKQRYNELMEIQQQISYDINKARIGKTYKTLVEGVAEDGIFYKGRTYEEGPEVDGVVYFTSEEPLEEGTFVNVKILIAQEYDLTGEVI